MILRKHFSSALLAVLLALTSCGTVKDIAYFQNKVVNEPEAIDKHAGIVIQPKDMLSIVVSSRNPELGKYHIMGCMLSAASCNKWFCDNVLRTNDYARVQNNVDTESLGKNNVYFLPYLMGERSPINDTDATGVFVGLRLNTTAEDMLLAIMEGVSFAIRDNLEVVGAMGVPIKEATVCGGGAKSELWLNILANVLGIDLCVGESEEGPAMGAAFLAMLASGELSSIDELPRFPIKARVSPTKELTESYNQRYAKFKKIYPATKELYKEIR